MKSKQSLHISWHITAACTGVLIGTAAMLIVPWRIFTGGEWVVLAVLLFFAAIIKRRARLLAAAALGGLCLGLWSGANHQKELSKYEPYYGQQITLAGTVADDTTRGTKGDMRLRLKHIELNGQTLTGQVWASVVTNADIKRGDKVTLEGILGERFGTLSGTVFRSELIDVVRPVPGDVARQVRDSFTEKVDAAIPQPQASLGVSYVAGQRRALPETLSDEFRTLGLVHLVVASGFHLTLIVRFARRLLAGLSKYLATMASFAMIGCFLLLTGFSTSMVRASLVTGLSLAAWYYGRVVHPVKLLLIVAAITVFINPVFIWGDIGWFLSFAAFGGVIILAPLLHDYFWGPDKKPGFIRQLVVATTAAQITTFPIIAFVFGQYSSLALVANLLILPLVPPAMLLTVLAGMVAYIIPPLAPLVGLPAYAILTYMTSVTGRMASLPWSQGEITVSFAAVAIAHGLILMIILYLWRRTGHSFRRDSIV